MIKPVSGMQDVVSLLDDIVVTKPHLPPLVIVTTSNDTDEARGFLDGYRARLSDIKGRDLVPHAYAGPITLAKAKTHNSPDVGLLDELAKQLRSTIPAGAGRRWRTRRFSTCLDVVEAAGEIDTTSAETTRAQLLEWLYGRWEKRAPLLSWSRKMSTNIELPGKVFGLVVTALLHGPSRWWFGRRLNSRGLRWFGDHVSNANGLHGDFLDQAVWLLPNSGLEDVASLRRRILFDALLRDIALFMRRRRFLPHRRRRRWTPVLLLDGTDPLAATLVDLFVELTKDWTIAPLLVITALNHADAATQSGQLHTVTDVVQPLRSFVNGEAKALAAVPWLFVLLHGEPADDTIAAQWIKSHRRVTPRVPGRMSAMAPLLVTALAVAAVAGFAAYRYYASGCLDTKINEHGERVGVIESGCSFDQPDAAEGVPNLNDLEKDVFDNNDAIDKIKNTEGDPRYYREVVFFAPLTRPDASERTAPANAIWQLEGAVQAQAKHNEAAMANNQLVPIKLVLANSGDRFEDGDWVAERIMERPQSNRGDLAAVIGISQSRPVVSRVIKDHLGDVPVIGSSMYGSLMTKDNDNMFMSAPLNKAFARSMAEWTKDKSYAGAAVIYDPADKFYSRELHDLLREEGVGTPETDIEVEEKNSQGISRERLKTLCAQADTVVPVFTSRADQIRKLLDAASTVSECSNREVPIRMLAGPGVIVEAASGNLANYSWAHLTITTLAPTAADSDRATGADAFQVAAEAVKQAHESAQDIWGPTLVRTLLSSPEFTVDGRTGQIKLNDGTETASNRIQLIEVP